jgi:RNA polymerase sigma-70 factor (ECF subfamily)
VTESELLQKIKQNPAYFSELFILYYKPVFGYIFRRTGNFEDTADITADTFLKAFNHIRYFSYRGISIKVWLFRIATNEVNIFFRQYVKKNSVIERLDFENKKQFIHLLESDKEALENELQLHQQFLEVLNSLKTLPAKYQEVISLKYFEGKSNKEIAEILDIKEGTLKSLLSRGLEKLRKKCNQL